MADISLKGHAVVGCRILRSFTRNVFFLLSLLMTSGCTLPLFPAAEPDLQRYLQKAPIFTNEHFAIHHLPTEFDGEQILKQASITEEAIGQWLPIRPATTPVRILIFTATDPVGKRLLKKRHSRHLATGYYNHDDRIVLVTGQINDPRFLTVFRHEIAHAMLHNALPSGARIPFWLNEGISSFFEQEVNEDFLPNRANERLRLVQYQLVHGRELHLKNLIDSPFPKFISGVSYARSWGLIAYLYFHKRPITCYLNGLIERERTSNPHHLFQRCFLGEKESFESFEASCSQWLLSL